MSDNKTIKLPDEIKNQFIEMLTSSPAVGNILTAFLLGKGEDIITQKFELTHDLNLSVKEKEIDG